MKRSESNLILTVGLPYSGKSQWARSQSECPIVCPDSIRWATTGRRYYQNFEPMTWALAKIFVRSLFLAGNRTVIVNATHTTEKRREFWADDSWIRNFIVMDISAECCVARAQKNSDRAILPIIERMANAQEYNGICYGDRYTNREKDDPMADHIQRPDGLKDLQIYHNGYSLDI